MSDASNGLSNRTRYSPGSSQENRLINPSSSSSHISYALPSGRLSWRSRSQPPFGDVGHNTGNANSFDQQSPIFLNTESNQQMSSAGTELPVTSSVHSSALRTVSHTTMSSSTSRYRTSFHNTSRTLNNSRPSTSRRTLRSLRFQPNHETTGLSSSSSNTSLTGRYRTVSGVREPVEEVSSSDTHFLPLLRFASLTIDGDPPPNQPVPLAMQEGSSDLDEFPALPVRSTTEHPIPNLRSSYSNRTYLRHPRDRPVSDGVVAGLLIDSYSRSMARSTAASETSRPTAGDTPAPPRLDSLSSPHSVPHSTSEVVLTTNPAENQEMETRVSSSVPSSSVIVRFPLRELRNQTHMANPSASTNPHQEPEADHDFYRSDLPRSPYRCDDQIRRVLSGVNELRLGGQFCDVILQAGSTKIPAHRNILASSSQYFYAMFTGPMAEARSACVKIHDVDEMALSQLIDFIYTGEICVTEDTVQTLLPAANLLQLNSVRDACCDFLQSQLHPSNCLGIQRFADLHDCPDLLASSRRFTEQHFGELLDQDEEFLALSADQLVQLISSDQLAVSEDRVFEAVLRWVAHDVDRRQEAAPSLCSRVRFSLLPRDYLVRLSQSDTFLAANPWCKDYLIEALSYHLLSWEQKLLVNSERAKPRTPIGLPKILIVVGGQAPKAVRSIEYFEFRTGHWRSGIVDPQTAQSSPALVDTQPSESLSPPQLTSTPSSTALVFSSIAGTSLPPSNIADLPSRRCRCGVAVVGGLVYVVGGFNGALRVRSVEVYDPVRNSWHSGPNMECRRATLGVAVLNGRIYAIGGFDGNAGLNTAEVFDLCSGSWRFISPMSCRRSSVGAGALDGKIYAVGGYDGIARRCLSSVECYDPVANVWTPVADMTCRRSGPAVGELNNRLYAVGGHDGPVVRNTAEVYSPETGTWQRIADLNVRRRNAGLVAHDGFLYVVGGEDGEVNLPTIEKYDPSSNTWTLLPGQMKLGRSYAGVAVIERNTFV